MKYSVYLRPFIPGDEVLINKWRNDESIQALTCGRFRLVSLEIEKKWVYDKMTHNSTDEYFAICLNDGSDTMIGYFSIREIDVYNRKAHFAGIVIDPEFQDGIYMIDTNIIALDYAFRHLGLNRVTGACLEQHIASRVMMEIFGFKLEGIEKESVYKGHEFHNVCKYAIIYSEYKKNIDEGQYAISKLAKRAAQIKKSYTKNGN